MEKWKNEKNEKKKTEKWKNIAKKSKKWKDEKKWKNEKMEKKYDEKEKMEQMKKCTARDDTSSFSATTLRDGRTLHSYP